MVTLTSVWDPHTAGKDNQNQEVGDYDLYSLVYSEKTFSASVKIYLFEFSLSFRILIHYSRWFLTGWNLVLKLQAIGPDTIS